MAGRVRGIYVMIAGTGGGEDEEAGERGDREEG
jgi:hypothetical protein